MNSTERRGREWCSEKCRKDTLYAGECENCGAPTDGSNGRGPNASKLCAFCAATQNADRNERLIEMWEAGEPTGHIAEELGMSEIAVRAWVDIARHRYGYDLPLRRCRNREFWLQILSLREKGLSCKEIGTQIGRSPAGVNHMLRNMRKAGMKVP